VTMIIKNTSEPVLTLLNS